MRIGLELTIGSDWQELVREHNEVLLTRRNIAGDQGHFSWLNKLIGRKIQIEYQFKDTSGFGDTHHYRLAIDGHPALLIGEEWGNNFFTDSAEIKAGEGGYLYGDIVMYQNNSLWRENHELKEIREAVAKANNVGLNSFFQATEDFIKISDVEFDRYGSSPFEIEIGDGLYSVLTGRSSGICAPLRNTIPEAELLTLLTKVGPVDDRDGRHIIWSINSLFEDLTLFRELLEAIIAVSTKFCVVGGDREVLKPSQTEFLVQPNFHEKPVLSSVETYPAIAAALAANSSRDKDFKHMAAYTVQNATGWKSAPPSAKLIQQWLKSLTTPGPEYLLCADGYCLVKKAGTKIEESWRFGFPDFATNSLFLKLYLKDKHERIMDMSDVGSGISHVLPVLAALWTQPFSYIHQPELHLHPSAQCELGDIFISAANSGASALIETHSEHALLRILRRIRETNEGRCPDKAKAIDSKQIAIYYFEPLEDGSSRVKEIRLSSAGEFIDRWPKGFFTERSRELFS
jgi:hypothetical protein